MKNTTIIIVAIIVIVVLILLGVRMFSQPQSLETTTPMMTTQTARLTASSSASTSSAQPMIGQTSISIQNFSFSPSNLTVAKGTTVNWKNNDSVTHTITSDTNAFNSGNIAQGATYSNTFAKTGVFAYHCQIHPSMTGTITVQ